MRIDAPKKSGIREKIGCVAAILLVVSVSFAIPLSADSGYSSVIGSDSAGYVYEITDGATEEELEKIQLDKSYIAKKGLENLWLIFFESPLILEKVTWDHFSYKEGEGEEYVDDELHRVKANVLEIQGLRAEYRVIYDDAMIDSGFTDLHYDGATDFKDALIDEFGTNYHIGDRIIFTGDIYSIFSTKIGNEFGFIDEDNLVKTKETEDGYGYDDGKINIEVIGVDGSRKSMEIDFTGNVWSNLVTEYRFATEIPDIVEGDKCIEWPKINIEGKMKFRLYLSDEQYTASPITDVDPEKRVLPVDIIPADYEKGSREFDIGSIRDRIKELPTDCEHIIVKTTYSDVEALYKEIKDEVVKEKDYRLPFIAAGIVIGIILAISLLKRHVRKMNLSP